MSQGLYLYCLAKLSRLAAFSLGSQGLDGQNSLTLATYQDIAAVWSPVPVEDFSGPEGEARLQDLNWITPRVLRHQEVLAGVMRLSPVLPAQFGTIFASLDNLEKVLRRHHNIIAQCLDRLTDQEEWAVKGMMDRSATQEKLFSLKLAQEAEKLAGLMPGKRYFAEQRLRAACDQELQQWLQKVCREAWADLRTYTTEARQRRLLSRQATGSDQDMVWNWAFLVPAANVPALKAGIRDANALYAEYGLQLDCTGPWPPYSFTPTLEMEAEA